MHILFLNTLYHPFTAGGAEKSVRLLAEELVDMGNTCTVITLHEHEHIDEEVINKVKVIRVPLYNDYWPDKNANPSRIGKLVWHLKDIYNRKMQRAVYDLLKQEAPDVVHSNNLSGFSVSVWNAAYKLGIPVLHTARDYYLLNPNSTLYKREKNHSATSFDSLIFSYFKKKMSQKVNCFVGISEFVLNIHNERNFFGKAQKAVIYNSIEQNVGIKSELRNGNDITLGFLGRVERIKGIEFLLEALKNSTNDHIVKLRVAGVGDGNYIAELKQKYSNLNVEFLGKSDIRDFFPSIDALVVPSLWNEPMGRVVLEANAAGIPVLASDRGGIPEIVSVNKTGFVFNATSTNSLTTILNQLDINTVQNMKEQCLIYSGHFTKHKVAEKYSDLYNKILLRK